MKTHPHIYVAKLLKSNNNSNNNVNNKNGHVQQCTMVVCGDGMLRVEMLIITKMMMI